MGKRRGKLGFVSLICPGERNINYLLCLPPPSPSLHQSRNLSRVMAAALLCFMSGVVCESDLEPTT